MSDNVIRFPRGTEWKRPDSNERREELRARDLRLLRWLEHKSGGKKGRVFVTVHDRIMAAKATGRMLEEVKQKGIAVSEVRAKFGDSGRIDRYTMASNADPLSPEIKNKANRKLMQQISGYLRLADILAELLGRDADHAKIDVLKDTSLWSRADSSADKHESDERALHLTLMVQEMARSVIDREELAKLFSRARKIPGRWDVHFERFRPSSMVSLFQPGYEDWLEHWHDEGPPPLPSVPLVRLWHAMVQMPLLVGTQGASEVSPEMPGSAEFEGEKREGVFKIFREIRLCLGPTRAPDQLGAMFETRAHIVVSFVGNEQGQLLPIMPHCDFRWLGTYGGYIRTEDAWHRFGLLADADLGDLEFWPITPIGKDTWPVEHYWFSWTPVRDDYVSYWLDREDGEHFPLDQGPRLPLREQWYVRPSLAHFVERDIETGAIERALKAQIHKIRKALDQREEEWRSAAREKTRRLLDLWKGDRPNEP